MTLSEPKSAPEEVLVRSRPSRLMSWLVAALVVALVAVVGLVVASVSEEEPEYAGVSDGVAAMLDERIDAYNRGDIAAVADLFAEDGVMNELDVPLVSRGRDKVEARFQELYDFGMRLEALGEPTQSGIYVAEPAQAWIAGAREEGRLQFMLVYELDKAGKIAYEWIILRPEKSEPVPFD